LLDLAIWKIGQLIKRPFRFRTQCFLQCERVTLSTEDGLVQGPSSDETESNDPAGHDAEQDAERANSASANAANRLFGGVNIKESIKKCEFSATATHVYYAANELFKAGKGTESPSDDGEASEADEE